MRAGSQRASAVLANPAVVVEQGPRHGHLVGHRQVPQPSCGSCTHYRVCARGGVRHHRDGVRAVDQARKVGGFGDQTHDQATNRDHIEYPDVSWCLTHAKWTHLAGVQIKQPWRTITG